MMSPLSARGGRGGRKGKRGVPFFLLSSLLSISISSSTVAAAAGFKPKAQFCKFGHSKSEIDFCMGLSTLSNNSTSHLSLSIRKSFSKGWTAVGTGESMTDSLMFIVYGDPESADSRAPVVSVRTAGGHEKPRPVNFLSINGDEVKGVDFFASGGGAGAGTGGGKVKVVKAAWERLGGHEGNTKDHNKKKRHEDEDEETESTQGKEPKYAARVEIVCEGCNWEDDATKWGSRGDVMPWIWAWNERQDFTESEREFDVAAGLHMHRHHEGSGGFGRFWVDLGRAKVAESEEAKWDGGSEMDWSVFEAKQENERIGTSDLPPAGSGGGAGGWMRNWSWAKFHGLMMAIGFSLHVPAGVVIIRMSNDGKSEKKGSSSSSPFKRHWRVQMAATVLAVAGGVTGGVISRWRMPRTVHQWLGASILMGLLIQSILGWRHHMVFLRIKRRTWISHAHIWLGRAIVLGGLVNILLGMLLSGHEVSSVAFVGAVVLAEVVGLGYFVWRAQRRAEVERQLALLTSEVEGHALMPRESNVGNDYFAVGMSQDDSDDDNDDTDRRRLRKKPEVHEARSSADAKV